MSVKLFFICFESIYVLMNRVKIFPPIMADFGFTFSNTDLLQLDRDKALIGCYGVFCNN